MKEWTDRSTGLTSFLCTTTTFRVVQQRSVFENIAAEMDLVRGLDLTTLVGRTILCRAPRRQKSRFCRSVHHSHRDHEVANGGIRIGVMVSLALPLKNGVPMARSVVCQCSPDDLKRTTRTDPSSPVLRNLGFLALGIGLLFFLSEISLEKFMSSI